MPKIDGRKLEEWELMQLAASALRRSIAGLTRQAEDLERLAATKKAREHLPTFYENLAKGIANRAEEGELPF